MILYREYTLWVKLKYPFFAAKIEGKGRKEPLFLLAVIDFATK